MAKSPKENSDPRLELFKSALKNNSSLISSFEKLYTEKNGDFETIIKTIKKNKAFTPALLEGLSLTHELTSWSGDNPALVSDLQKDKNIRSIRDVALNYSKDELAKKITPPKGENKTSYTEKLYKSLYEKEPTAVLTNIIQDPSIPVLNNETGVFISNLLVKYPDFNIRTNSVYTLLNRKEDFKQLNEKQKESVTASLKSLQRVAAISPAPAVIPALLNNNITSALLVTELPQDQFIKKMQKSKLPDEVWREVYVNAENRKIFNEQAIIRIKEAGEGSGIAFIDNFFKEVDKKSKKPGRERVPKNVSDSLGKNNLNWNLLFGDADYCECGECTSVYSAASYFVDLLQFLRNNDLDINATGSTAIKLDPKNISGTPLAVLFARRPDIGNLELSCKNTNTILPYIDLVNEVMEQYVAFNVTKAFNVANETSAELLSAPQHTEQTIAYQRLNEAVYPFSLPYNQAADHARINLNFLGTNRYELLGTFPSARTNINVLEPTRQGGTISATLPVTYNQSPYEISELNRLHAQFLQRATEAAYLFMSPEEYYIITGESFVSKEYWDTQGFVGGSHGISTPDQYRNKIGITPLETYYGYSSKTIMLSRNETKKDGLYFVKDQFLTRAGITIEELVELLKTRYINPPKSGSISLIPAQIILTDTCDIDALRMEVGAGQTAEMRYEKIHRFIRLWRKTGWSISQTDSFITILGNGNMNADLIHQGVAVKKIAAITGIDITKLLCFWGNIPASGDASLYSILFLSHNLSALDDLFKADANGEYLPLPYKKITDHVPAIMAALNLSSIEIQIIREYLQMPDEINLPNLSALYRFRLLSKTLGLRIQEFVNALPVFGDVFTNADVTLQFLENWKSLEESGFTIAQLNYIVHGTDNGSQPLKPNDQAVIGVTLQLYTGIEAINEAHKEITHDDEATSELLKEKLAMWFDGNVADQVLSLLDGTTLYKSDAPAGLSIIIPGTSSLNEKITYDKGKRGLQVKGILSPAEITELKALVNDNAWRQAVDAIDNQKDIVFNTFLSQLFAGVVTARNVLLQPDTGFVVATAKRYFFIQTFLPFLKNQLTQNFIHETLAASSGLDRDIANLITKDIMPAAVDTIVTLRQPNNINAWEGYVGSKVTGDYRFNITQNNQPQNLLLENNTVVFHAVTGSNNVWESDAIHFEENKLYKLSRAGSATGLLPWKLEIPVFATYPVFTVMEGLKKMELLINTYQLSIDEIRYLHTHAADFDQLDFNAIQLTHCLRLSSYCSLRNSLTTSSINIIEFWKWVKSNSVNAADGIKKLALLLQAKKEQVENLLKPDHFNLGIAGFNNEINLLKLRRSLQATEKIGLDIDLLFTSSLPNPSFEKMRTTAESIQKAIRSKYNQTDWEQVVKPLSDELRNNQKEALVSYLLQQNTLKRAGVTDAGDLFEYFLIDVEMDTCMETSRIKQAISSVQLFIQRCLLGLEKKNNIGPNLLDRNRWSWMQRYRVWEANRKVFLYPENWIESNLRDDKSSFFKELESELLQKDISKDNVTDALKAYLYKADEIANMQVLGLYIEGVKTGTEWNPGAKLHVFSRTQNTPCFFYYRYLALDEMNWYPWEKMAVDIPSHNVEDASGHVTRNGCYLLPVVWNDRLFVFFPQFVKKTKPLAALDKADMSFVVDLPPNAQKPTDFWEIQLAYSEYKNKKWQPKQISNVAVYDAPNETTFSTKVADLLFLISKLATTKNEIKKLEAEMERLKDELQNAIGTANVSAQINILGQFMSKSQAITLAKTKLDTTEKSIIVYKAAVVNFARPVLYDLSVYSVFSIKYNNDQSLAIKIFRNNGPRVGAFEFDGHSLKLNTNSPMNANGISASDFQYVNQEIIPHQFPVATNDRYVFSSPPSTYNNQLPFNFSSPAELIKKINNGSLEDVFKFNLSITDKANGFGAWTSNNQPSYHELKRTYSIYNWELFFHTPLLLATALSSGQQFEESMKWFHYVFNPIAEGTDEKRFWQFAPFKEINSKNILDQVFNQLSPNQYNEAISEWRNNPFKPHLIARSRPVAYMKWVVMKYVDNILAWGDYLFRQDTIESINQATQLYILALHILGPRPQHVPERGKLKTQTFNSLLDKWDAFSNAMSEFEVAVPFINSTAIATPVMQQAFHPDLFGSAAALYFCIPENPKLLGYWDTLADRLYKIRHCENIEGVFRKLPLFEPPIDPALLVKAAAQGISLDAVINDLNSPMPNYRFYYLLQKALELCGELKSLGGAMLSAIEKKDNEAIALIRARHESSMQNLVMEIKKQQLEESHKAIEALQNSRKGPEHRMKYYLQLIGEDAGKVPGTDSDFSEVANAIERPVDESGLKLIRFEKEDMDKAGEAHLMQKDIGQKELLASILHLVPTAAVDVKPFGIGVGIQFGGPFLGGAMQAWAKSLQNDANDKSYGSTNASKKGSFLRALQERVMQANAAGYEIKQIDKQILSQQVRIQIANLELSNQQKQIDNANEVEEFLKNKYSNDELYTWMRGSLKTLYHQVYNLAYEVAKKAEKTYCFERGISQSNFISTGYFDAGRDGLLAGEQLYVGLKQLEAAYQEKRGYDYEITKHISLRQLDPMAILQLKTYGSCEFEIPEFIFDMDYPGQFKRRIKSISISIPCITGPYTGVNATLRMLNNKFRNSAIANNAANYPEKTDQEDERFTSYNIPVSAIATSTAQNDAGMFELNFKDERYLPFEGAGAISKWRLELPSLRQFNYNTISDAILHIRYISNEGGDQLKNIARSYTNMILSGAEEKLFSLIDFKHDMPNEWNLLNKNYSVGFVINKTRLSYLAVNLAETAQVELIVVANKNLSSLKLEFPTVNPVTTIAMTFNPLQNRLFVARPGNINLNKLYNLSVSNAEMDETTEIIIIIGYTI